MSNANTKSSSHCRTNEDKNAARTEQRPVSAEPKMHRGRGRGEILVVSTLIEREGQNILSRIDRERVRDTREENCRQRHVHKLITVKVFLSALSKTNSISNEKIKTDRTRARGKEIPSVQNRQNSVSISRRRTQMILIDEK